ncbi:MAG: type II toxin-antitoxin system Phd/YefM family antitoxin [Vicinamibacterales bacterium]
MDTVGVRELKTHLSRHLKRVRAGARLVVTERGRAVATLEPVEPPPADTSWARQVTAEGGAHWNGGKPAGARRPAKLTGRTAASVVLEQRR